MITTDQLLIEFYNFGIHKFDTKIPTKDRKILSSLARQVSQGNFLTENQGNLLAKIFQENKLWLPHVSDEQSTTIETPQWSERFRVIDQVRKIYSSTTPEANLVVEFTYNKKIKQVMADLNKLIQGQIQSQTRFYFIPLTEKNIYNVVKSLKNYNFQIDPKIWQFYQEIAKILESKENPFDVFSVKNEKYQKIISAEVGDISLENLTLLNDRRHTYQYYISEKNQEKSLKNSIANRKNLKVYVDSSHYSLDELLTSLIDLNRLPALFIFNGHDVKESSENLEKLEKSVKNLSISDVGIYFRFDNNTDANKNFNASISSLGFNQDLSNRTKVVGVSNNKLPKFLIKSPWYPKSVVSFTNNFRNNKTSFYCDAVDLIVYYNSKQPLSGDVDAIV